MGIEITVAGHVIGDALAELEGYSAKHLDTLKKYDLAEHGSSELTAAMVAAKRPALGYSKTHWGAIRNDVIANEAALLEPRSQGRSSANPLVQTVARTVSDVRLLDLLAWKI